MLSVQNTRGLFFAAAMWLAAVEAQSQGIPGRHGPEGSGGGDAKVIKEEFSENELGKILEFQKALHGERIEFSEGNCSSTSDGEPGDFCTLSNQYFTLLKKPVDGLTPKEFFEQIVKWDIRETESCFEVQDGQKVERDGSADWTTNTICLSLSRLKGREFPSREAASRGIGALIHHEFFHLLTKSADEKLPDFASEEYGYQDSPEETERRAIRAYEEVEQIFEEVVRSAAKWDLAAKSPAMAELTLCMAAMDFKEAVDETVDATYEVELISQKESVVRALAGLSLRASLISVMTCSEGLFREQFYDQVFSEKRAIPFAVYIARTQKIFPPEEDGDESQTPEELEEQRRETARVFSGLQIGYIPPPSQPLGRAGAVASELEKAVDEARFIQTTLKGLAHRFGFSLPEYSAESEAPKD